MPVDLSKLEEHPSERTYVVGSVSILPSLCLFILGSTFASFAPRDEISLCSVTKTLLDIANGLSDAFPPLKSWLGGIATFLVRAYRSRPRSLELRLLITRKEPLHILPTSSRIHLTGFSEARERRRRYYVIVLSDLWTVTIQILE